MKQFLEGKLTLGALAISAVAHVLNSLGVVPEGYSAEIAAGVLVGLGVAAYGRIRREFADRKARQG